MAIKGTEDVALMRPAEEDRYGDPSGEPVTLAIFERCVVWPRQSTEVAVEGNVIIEGYNVWIPFAQNRGELEVINEVLGDILEIAATDMVMVRGDAWQVKGTPADHRSMRGKKQGIQMVVGRVA